MPEPLKQKDANDSGLNFEAHFNMSDCDVKNLRQDARWRIKLPPVNNANYAWIRLFIHHPSPAGVVGFGMAKIKRTAHSCSMRITADVTLKKGMEEKSREFTEMSSELYAKA